MCRTKRGNLLSICPNIYVVEPQTSNYSSKFQESVKFKVDNPRKFHYLNQSNFYELKGVDESQEYLATKKAMDVVGISSDEQVWSNLIKCILILEKYKNLT